MTLTDSQRESAREGARGLLFAALASVPVAVYQALSLSEFGWFPAPIAIAITVVLYGVLLGHAGIELRRLATATDPVELDRFLDALDRAWLLRLLLPFLIVAIALFG